MKKILNTRHAFSKIDDILENYGFSCFRDGNPLKVYEDCGDCFMHYCTFSSKKELIEFANKLQENKNV